MADTAQRKVLVLRITVGDLEQVLARASPHSRPSRLAELIRDAGRVTLESVDDPLQTITTKPLLPEEHPDWLLALYKEVTGDDPSGREESILRVMRACRWAYSDSAGARVLDNADWSGDEVRLLSLAVRIRLAHLDSAGREDETTPLSPEELADVLPHLSKTGDCVEILRGGEPAHFQTDVQAFDPTDPEAMPDAVLDLGQRVTALETEHRKQAAALSDSIAALESQALLPVREAEHWQVSVATDHAITQLTARVVDLGNRFRAIETGTQTEPNPSDGV